jgi:hypothetical protein
MGAVGRALSLDLGAYLASREDALVILRTAIREPDYSALFHATESYRAGADGQEKTVNLLRALSSLIEDLLLIVAGTPLLIRNIDLAADLSRLSEGLTVDWIDSAARALVQVEQGHAPQPAALALARRHGRGPRGRQRPLIPFRCPPSTGQCPLFTIICSLPAAATLDAVHKWPQNERATPNRTQASSQYEYSHSS